MADSLKEVYTELYDALYMAGGIVGTCCGEQPLGGEESVTAALAAAHKLLDDARDTLISNSLLFGYRDSIDHNAEVPHA